MAERKGFSLVEIAVVLVITAVIAAFVIVPTYNNFTQQSMAQNTGNNLMAMMNAQKLYYFNNGRYCLNDTGCGISLASLNTNLKLNIVDQYTYRCFVGAGGPGTLECLAYFGDTQVVAETGLTLFACRNAVNPQFCPPNNSIGTPTY